MPDSEELKARVVKKRARKWSNKHENFTVPVAAIYDIWNPSVPDNRMIDGYRATTRTFQELAGKAISENLRLRSIGSAWSISRAPVTHGWLINTKPLNWVFRISKASVSEDYKGQVSDLLFAQCGVSIGELNRYLGKSEKTLKTSGASNGQTIAGALSTGTHGSAMEIGAVQDFVVGLHLITGPGRHVWLERSSYPVTTGRFAERLGAEVIRDDEIFNAALVSFGSFGIIQGVMIETEEIFLLEASRFKIPFDQDLRHVIHTLDFDRVALPEENVKPYHFEVVINPHATDGQAFSTVMYKKPYQPGYKRRGGSQRRFQAGDDFLSVIGTLLDVVQDGVPVAVNTLLASQYRSYEGRVGTLGDIFSTTSIRGKSTGAAMGVPLQEAERALQVILDVHKTSDLFPGVFALRYVKKSEALLAFTRFDMTCIIDLDAVDNRSAHRFFRRVWEAFDQEEIPYTVHWGKANELTPELLEKMYEDDLDRWLSVRKDLLGEKACQAFSSPFTDQCGLSG